jgi:hypothetical protein
MVRTPPDDLIGEFGFAPPKRRRSEDQPRSHGPRWVRSAKASFGILGPLPGAMVLTHRRQAAPGAGGLIGLH